jgi:hypothetical protein
VKCDLQSVAPVNTGIVGRIVIIVAERRP